MILHDITSYHILMSWSGENSEWLCLTFFFLHHRGSIEVAWAIPTVWRSICPTPWSIGRWIRRSSGHICRIWWPWRWAFLFEAPAGKCGKSHSKSFKTGGRICSFTKSWVRDTDRTGSLKAKAGVWARLLRTRTIVGTTVARNSLIYRI